jgi:L-rhamnose mutarotase
VDLSAFRKENDGFRYIITIIDTFSKKAWAFKLKRKTGKAIFDVMKPFFQSRKPQKIQFDQGTEFYNKLFLGLLKKHKIEHYSVYSEVKASIVERFNRTLRHLMVRHFNSSGSHRWVDVLQDLIHGYNESKHRSIGFAPNDVNESNESMVRKNLFPEVKKQKKHQKAHFKVGDTVRITRKKNLFEKGWDISWSWEVFTVSEIKNTYPKTYGLTDFSGQSIKGSFYKNELQLVDKSDNIWPIEKVVRTRKKNGQTEYFVKFLGYPDSANTWIPHSELFAV